MRTIFMRYCLKSENENDWMQSEDNDAGGLTPTKEADEVVR